MKKLFIASIITLAAVGASAQTKKPVTTTKKSTTAGKTTKVITKTPLFKSTLDSASYALGINVASSFKGGGLNSINYELFNKGLRDAFASANPILTQQQCQEAINNLFESYSAQRAAANKKNEDAEKVKYASIIKEGEAFLLQNKNKPGVISLPSGMQYQVIVQGSGAKPASSADVVQVNYKGTLLNGVEFDASEKHGGPVTFPLNRVIAGWTEGVQLMQEGSKYRFFIPYNLAYGSRATPDGSIPPFSTLIFEVELVKVNPPSGN